MPFLQDMSIGAKMSHLSLNYPSSPSFWLFLSNTKTATNVPPRLYCLVSTMDSGKNLVPFSPLVVASGHSQELGLWAGGVSNWVISLIVELSA